MELKDIDKPRYRKHLNRVIVGFIASLTILALLFGYVLIAVFSSPGEDNFKLNLAGALMGLVICGGVLSKLKSSAYFYEIYYVWQLKQLQNQIYRKLKKIKLATETNNMKAVGILYFYYTSLRQVYLLDDNTLTMSKVNGDLQVLQGKAEAEGVDLDSLIFDKQDLKAF